MHTKHSSHRGTRSLIAGLLMVGLAACQPASVPLATGGTKASGSLTARTTPTARTTSTAPGWTLVGGDEFDGTSIDLGRWKPYHSTYGDSNNELACLTPASVTEGGGTARITAVKQPVSCPGGTTEQYTSGFLGSRETGTYYPAYARFEIRAKVPHAQGLWPAFWLRHRNGASTAEVDIMEYFHSQVPGRTTQTLHLDGRSNLSKRTTSFEPPTASPAFHVWAVEITRDPSGVRFTFLLDGAITHTYVDTQHTWLAAAPAAGTWDIALNLAVGGNWVGAPDDPLGYLRNLDRCSIGGSAPGGCATTGIRRVDWSAATYEIDYVRVYTAR